MCGYPIVGFAIASSRLKHLMPNPKFGVYDPNREMKVADSCDYELMQK